MSRMAALRHDQQDRAQQDPTQQDRTPRVPCAGDPELMFPLEESQRAEQAPTTGERAALAVCRTCPLLQACRAQVLEQPLPYGVAGGLTAAQRRGVRARRAGRADGQRPEVAA